MWVSDFTGLGVLLQQLKDLTVALEAGTAKEMTNRLELMAKATYHQTQLKMDMRDPVSELEQAQMILAELQSKMGIP